MKARHHRKGISAKARKHTRTAAKKKASAKGRQSARPSVRRRPPRDPRSPSEQATVVTASAYACSKCGFRTDLDDPDWSNTEIPVWNPKGKRAQDCWSLCPNDGGPDSTHLTAPNRLEQRYRMAFQSGGKTIRACTPSVIRQRTSTGGVHLGLALGHDAVWREIRLQESLASQGLDPDIDLRRLADTSSMTGSLHCYQVKDSWLLALRTWIPRDSWEHKTDKLLLSSGHEALWRKLRDLVAYIDSALCARVSWDHVLHVPIDMTRPIETQLDRIRSHLVEAREYLYRYTAKKPPRDKSRTTWRDIYIYLLATIAGRSSASIGEEVFPNENSRSRHAKVNQIIRMVRLAAEAVNLHAQSPKKK